MVHTERVRADAVRNRARILEAARAVVTETGADAAMEDIARRAGVAVGTLYRHFPAKTDLVTAVVARSVDRIADLAGAALAEADAGGSPGALLDRLFRAVAEEHATDRVFKEAAGRLHDPARAGAPGPGTAEHRAGAAITALLDRARAAGEVRAEVEMADLLVLLSGVPGLDVPPQRRRTYVDVVLAGLRTA